MFEPPTPGARHLSETRRGPKEGWRAAGKHRTRPRPGPARGAAVAAGPLEETLTSERLSEAFGTALKVTRADGRYTAVAA